MTQIKHLIHLEQLKVDEFGLVGEWSYSASGSEILALYEEVKTAIAISRNVS
jgi:hypothetical protein